MSHAGLDYNAVVIEIRFVHDALMILKIRADGEVSAFERGQYTTLGLRASEPRIELTIPAGIDSEGSPGFRIPGLRDAPTRATQPKKRCCGKVPLTNRVSLGSRVLNP